MRAAGDRRPARHVPLLLAYSNLRTPDRRGTSKTIKLTQFDLREMATVSPKAGPAGTGMAVLSGK
jgi:hypothetical protein